MKPKSRHRAKYPKVFTPKPANPLTAKTLARRIAREDERADRHTAGFSSSKAPRSSARAKPPQEAPTLQDHEQRIRAIEEILFGKDHSSQTRQWLLEGIGRSKPLTGSALGSFLDDWEAKHGGLTPDELTAGRLPLKAPKPRRSVENAGGITMHSNPAPTSIFQAPR
jgi:hypothetical protein